MTIQDKIKTRIAELEIRLKHEQDKVFTTDEVGSFKAIVSNNCTIVYVFAISELEKLLKK